MKPKVLIIMGSDSDLPVMEETEKILKAFGISSETTIASAHRSPERAVKLAKGAEKKGVEVIIAGAGAAAHLAGVIAAHTILPVIGVPINSSPLQGFDALFSTVQNSCRNDGCWDGRRKECGNLCRRDYWKEGCKDCKAIERA